MDLASLSSRFRLQSLLYPHIYMQAVWLGCVDYAACWELQRELAALRRSGSIGDILLLLEHPPTITLGRSADPRHVLAPRERLNDLGVALYPVDRGGDVTCHGPGQLVGYPIFDLSGHRKDLHWFLRQIEEALIQAIAEFGVQGRRFPPHTGVWIGNEKVAAIGIKVSHWITSHGFALNLGADTDLFKLIVPCGIEDYGVISLSKAADRVVTVEEAIAPIVKSFKNFFPCGEPDKQVVPHELTDCSQRIFEKALDAGKTLC